MSYDYQTERPKIFTEEGQRIFLKVRDKAYDLTSTSDCATFSKVMGGATGDSWLILACVERLIELEEFIEIPNPISSWAQHRIICRYMGR